MNLAYDGIGSLAATFQCGGTIPDGTPVSLSANNTVVTAASGKALAGILLHQREEYGAVQVKGYAEATYSGTAPTVGWQLLSGDGTGKVTCAATGSGRGCLVTWVDTTTSRMGFFL